MTRIEGADEVIKHMGPAGYREFARQLAQTECDTCKRLYGEHSPEEFKTHALGDVTIDLDIVPPTPHVMLHFRGHECADCAQCEECSKLLEEEKARA